MKPESKHLSLEEIIDKTFEEGYGYRLSEYHKKYIINAVSQIQEFQNTEFLNYLANTLATTSHFDLEKTLRLFSVCNGYFEDKQNRKTYNLKVLLPKLFLERIRYPFFYTSEENRKIIAERYYPKNYEYKPNSPFPFDSLRKNLTWGMSISEGDIAKVSEGLPEKIKVNLLLNALKHSAEALEYGLEEGIYYFSYIGNWLLNLGKTINCFNDPDSLANNLSKDLNEFFGNQIKKAKCLSIDDLCKWCFSESKRHYEKFFERYNNEEILEESEENEKTYAVSRANLGETCFFLAYHHGIEKSLREIFLAQSRTNFKDALEKGYDLEKLEEEFRNYTILCKLIH